MGTEALIAKINEKVDAQIAESDAKIKAEADAAIAAITGDCAKKCAAIISKGESDAKECIYRESLQAKLDSQNNTLAAKNAIVARVFAEVRTRLLAMSNQEKQSFYTKLVGANLPDDPKAVTCVASPDMLATAEALTAKFGFKCTGTASGEGVLILSNEMYDCDLSVDALVLDARDSSLTSVADILFN